ncbi:MAG: hypothetical protein ABL986_19750 [Vicinamibacterales bacterium]
MASAAAVTSAAGAVACGVCCVLPFAIPAVTAAGLGGVIAWFAGSLKPATYLSLALVSVAWVSVGAQSYTMRRSPSRSTMTAMAVATSILLLAFVWPRIEPVLISLVDRRP